jgi:cyanophycin synthetase
MGVSLDDIRQGLRTFDTTYFQAPGRLNVYDDHPFKVILDYAHNPHAVTAIVRFVDNLGAEGSKICVLGAPGDRRDEDIEEIATLCAGHFDHYICRRDDNPRGREPEDVPERLHAALLAAGVDESAIEVIADEQESIHAALSQAQHGDLLLVMGDKISRCWKQITTFSPDLEAPVPVETVVRPQVEVVEQLPDLDLPPVERLVRDERGVRLAREEEND